MSIDRGMDKENVVSLYNGILLSHKKWNNAICSNMDRPRHYLSEKSQRKTNAIWYHIYVESEIWYKWTCLQNRNALTNRKQIYGYKGGKGLEET